jgi:hypothetical protein
MMPSGGITVTSKPTGGFLVTLCAACDARVHRLCAYRVWLPPPVLKFWRSCNVRLTAVADWRP